MNQTAGLQCWIGLGLTYGCAQINNFNAIYDQKACGAACATLPPGSPNNLPPPTCSLNKCLQCDENKGDPTYKEWGGRSRRDTCLQSEIIRPCSSIAYLPVHDPCITKTTSVPVAPTLTPSQLPTSEPTLTPPLVPISKPTQKPNMRPTKKPSNKSPTKKPSNKWPTKKPSPKPKGMETDKKISPKPVKQVVTNKPFNVQQTLGETS